MLLVLYFRGGEMSAGQIASRFACSWPTTTRHLRVLEEAGLVTVTQRGRERVYRLERERLGGIVGDWLGWFESEGEEPAGKPATARKKRAKKTTSRR